MYVKLKHVNKVRSKGRVYYYHRKTGERLVGDPKHVPAAAMRVLEINKDLALKKEGAGTEGSVQDAIAVYKASPDFLTKAEKTRKDYTRYLDWIGEFFGPEPMADLDAEIVYEIRDALADKPRKADYTVQVLSLLCGFALKRPRRFGLQHNPCKSIDKLSKTEGYKPWPDDVIAAALETAYKELAEVIAMSFYAGQRGQDSVVMEWPQYDGQGIGLVQQKTGAILWVPTHPTLKAMLDAMPRRAKTILANRQGRPWGLDHLRHEIAALMRQIGAEGYSLHGLRKNAVNTLLEAGCSEGEVGAITGQTTQTIRHYARRVNQKRLAESAMRKLVQSENAL